MTQTLHIVITGGTGALGGAVVDRMLQAGTFCHVTYLEARELQHFAPRYHAHVQATRVDCSDETSVRAFFQGLPRVDASIHLVGGFSMAKIAETRLADFEAMFRLNAVSAFLCCREAVVRMRPLGGRIVNIAARPVLEPTASLSAYAASKAAVAALTTTLAREVAEDNILVNAVLPSIMDTPANRASQPSADFARWPKLDQVAEAIAFLALPTNTLTSGALVPVYGHA